MTGGEVCRENSHADIQDTAPCKQGVEKTMNKEDDYL